jgi:hypothetical protein
MYVYMCDIHSYTHTNTDIQHAHEYITRNLQDMNSTDPNRLRFAQDLSEALQFLREERDTYKGELLRHKAELARVQLTGWEQAALTRLREFRAAHAGGPEEDVRVVVVRKVDYENKIKMIAALQEEVKNSRYSPQCVRNHDVYACVRVCVRVCVRARACLWA